MKKYQVVTCREGACPEMLSHFETRKEAVAFILGRWGENFEGSDADVVNDSPRRIRVEPEREVWIESRNL